MRLALPFAVSLALGAAGCASPGGAPAGSGTFDEASPDDAPAVVFLVRHAEKADDGTADPPLTPEGRRRAGALAGELADAGLDRVYSTDYRRTRETAAPVVAAAGAPLELYDPGDLETMARRLRERAGRSLVVGHSNTTPTLVELLGGEPGPPIGEAWEYDRLYVLILRPGRPTGTVLLRYGAPPEASLPAQGSRPPASSLAASRTASGVSVSLAAAGARARARARAVAASVSRQRLKSTTASWR